MKKKKPANDNNPHPTPPRPKDNEQEEELPRGWSVHDSDSGKYYWNEETDKTSWEKPSNAPDTKQQVVNPVIARAVTSEETSENTTDTQSDEKMIKILRESIEYARQNNNKERAAKLQKKLDALEDAAFGL